MTKHILFEQTLLNRSETSFVPLSQSQCHSEMVWLRQRPRDNWSSISRRTNIGGIIKEPSK